MSVEIKFVWLLKTLRSDIIREKQPPADSASPREFWNICCCGRADDISCGCKGVIVRMWLLLEMGNMCAFKGGEAIRPVFFVISIAISPVTFLCWLDFLPEAEKKTVCLFQQQVDHFFCLLSVSHIFYKCLWSSEWSEVLHFIWPERAKSSKCLLSALSSR